MKIKMITDAPGGAISALESIITDLKNFSRKEQFDLDDFNSIISKMNSWLNHAYTFCKIEKRLEDQDYRDLSNRLHKTTEEWLNELSRDKLLLLYHNGEYDEDDSAEGLSQEELVSVIIESSSDAPFCLLDIKNKMLDGIY